MASNDKLWFEIGLRDEVTKDLDNIMKKAGILRTRLRDAFMISDKEMGFKTAYQNTEKLQRAYSAISNSLEKIKQARINVTDPNDIKRLFQMQMQLGKMRSELKKFEEELKANPSIMKDANLVDAFLQKIGYGSAIDQVNKKTNEYILRENEATQATRQLTQSQQGLVASYDKVVEAGKRTNNMLTQLKGQMMNAFSTYAVEHLLKSVIEIGGQFEVQHIALKSILGDVEQANTMFNEIKQLAVVSPFNFSQLVSYTKQVAAFNVPYEEMYETTKRLADMSAGLGIDMGRLILAYGQVRSAAVLRGQELRQFTEAGIPMVQALADEFTRLNGKLVTTGEVFELISRRAVPFEMVKKVLWDMTDEGGRFYNMQFTLADTLAGKWSNLVDAWQIMLSNFAKGESIGGRVLKYLVQSATDLLEVLDRITPLLAGLAALRMGRYVQGGIASIAGADIEKNVEKAQKLHAIELQRRLLNAQITKEQYNQGIALNKNKANFYMLLAMEGRLKESQIARAVQQGKINTQNVVARVRAKEITIEEGKQLLIWRQQYMQASIFNLKLKEIGLSIKAMLGPFGLISLAIDGILMAATTWYLKSEQATDKMNEAISNFVTSAKDRQKELADAFKTYNDKTPSNDEEYKNSINAMKEQLKQYDANYASIMREVDSLGTLQEQYEKLKEELGYVADGYDLASESKSDFERIYGDTEGLGEAAETWTKSNDYLNRSLNILAAEGTKNVERAIDSLAAKMPKLQELLYDENNKRRKTSDILRDFADKLTVGDIQQLRNAMEGYYSKKYDYRSVFEGLDKADKEKFEEYLVNARNRASEYDKNIASKIDKIVNETYVKVAAELGEKVDVLKERVEKSGNDLDQKTKTMLRNYFSQQMSAITNGNQSLMRWVDQQRWTLYFHYDIVTDYKDKTGGLQGIASSAWKRLNSGKGIYLDPSQHIGFTEKDMKDAFGASGNDVNNAKKVLSQQIKNQENVVKALETSKDATDAQKKEAKSLFDAMQFDWSSMFTDDWRNFDSKGNGGDKKDVELERIKNRVELYKKFYTELQNARKIYGQKAGEYLKESGFSDVFSKGEGGWNLSDVNNYGKSLDELTRSLADNTDARHKFLAGTDADKVVQKRKEEAEAIKDSVSELQNLLKVMTDNYNVYKKWLDLTGDSGIAAKMAGVAQNTSYSDYLKGEMEKALKEAGLDHSAKYVLGLDVEGAKEYGEDTKIYKIWEEYRKEVERVRKEDMDELYNATKKLMTVDEEILAIEKQIEELRAKGAKDYDPRILEKQQELSKKQMEQFENSEPYLKFYAAILSMTADEAEAAGAAIKKNLVDKLADGTINADKYLKSIKNVDSQLQKIRSDKGVFATLATSGFKGLYERNKGRQEDDVAANAIKIEKAQKELLDAERELQRVTEEGDRMSIANAEQRVRLAKEELEKLQNIQNTKQAYLESLIGDWSDANDIIAMFDLIGSGIDGLANSAQQLSNMFDALGQTSRAEGWSDAAGYISAIGSPVQSAVKVAKSAMSGDLGGVISNTVGIITSPITALANLHDKKLDRSIQKSVREVKKLGYAYQNIETAMEKALGGIYNTGGYNEMLSNLKRQREELQSQYEDEQDKKKSDADKLIDYQQQLLELDQQIKDFALDMANTLYSIDLHSIAGQLTDAVVSAWEKGEDAAEAYRDKVKDIVKDITTNILTRKVMEAAFERLGIDKIIENEMITKEGKLDEGSIVRLANALNEAGEITVNAITDILDQLDKNGTISKGDSTSSSASSSIKNITEETADILVSYVNAIRADVAYTRITLENIFNALHGDSTMTVIAQAQLDQLKLIVASTTRNADAADKIYDLLHGIAPDGQKVRVQ